MNISKIIDHKFWLAPLAGITDKAFRQICKENGVDVVVSEMVSADGIIYNKLKSLRYAEFTENQKPYGIQIFGAKPKNMKKAVQVLIERKPYFFDINMGCPVKKVVKRGAGSALMRTPDLACRIVKEVKKTLVNLEIPLSVKFRAGWDANSINAVKFGKKMESCGADILCLHPRTRSQMYSGKSDWNLIKLLKEKVNIPIIGNGDIRSSSDINRIYSFTKCDSVMMGRGLIGKPWLIQEIKDGRKLSVKQKIAIIRRHYDLTLENKGIRKGMLEMRKHLLSYTKGFRSARKTRELIIHTEDKEEALKAIEELYQRDYENDR